MSFECREYSQKMVASKNPETRILFLEQVHIPPMEEENHQL